MNLTDDLISASMVCTHQSPDWLILRGRKQNVADDRRVLTFNLQVLAIAGNLLLLLLGRIGRFILSVGWQEGSGEPSILASIQSLDAVSAVSLRYQWGSTRCIACVCRRVCPSRNPSWNNHSLRNEL